MYDLEKASISATGISLYVSTVPKGPRRSTRTGRRWVPWSGSAAGYMKKASSVKLQAASTWQLLHMGLY